MTFMFPDEQTPPLNKATIDHILDTVCNYAQAQLHQALVAENSFRTKLRLSRAIGALDAIKPFIGVNPAIDALRQECDRQWRIANEPPEAFDRYDEWIDGPIHDISEI